MVSIGGNVRPYVGDSAVQNISGKIVPYIGNTLISANASGSYAGGVGGVVSGGGLTSLDGFLEFNLSGQQIWVAYWISA